MIKRDGSCTSLWQQAAPYITKNTHAETTVYDAILAGGGITGLSTALLLQQSGKKCIVLEAATLCFGTTGGTTSHINTLLDTPYSTIGDDFGKENAALVARAVSEAIATIEENISRYQIECEFGKASGYLFSQDEKQTKELHKIKSATEEVGLPCNFENTLPIPVPFELVMKIEGQAAFNPVKYVHGLAKAFEEAGGVIVQDCRVEKSEGKNPVKVSTTKGTFEADVLIYATHIPTGINLLDLRCAPYRSYAMAVTLKSGQYPADMYYDMYDPYRYYRSQVIDGQPCFIVGGYDHKTAHEENTEKCFMELESHIRTYFDVEQVISKWSSQFYEPADGLPYIGHLPGHPDNVYVATGFSGNGMVYSHVAANIFKSILLEEESPYISLFNPSRIKPIAGFTEFVSHNADVVKQFIGKWLHREKLSELADLAPGEGKVVTYHDQKIALYKDEAHNLHAVNPTCTHMKCAVAWNLAEKTWDCPCHGARYSFDGEVITGPANINLEQIDIREEVES